MFTTWKDFGAGRHPFHLAWEHHKVNSQVLPAFRGVEAGSIERGVKSVIGEVRLRQEELRDLVLDHERGVDGSRFMLRF